MKKQIIIFTDGDYSVDLKNLPIIDMEDLLKDFDQEEYFKQCDKLKNKLNWR